MFKVYLGMSDISGVWYGNLKGGIEMNVATVIRVWFLNFNNFWEFLRDSFCYLKHPEYDDKNSLNDIGILKLDGEVQLNSKIQLACLPDPAKPDYPTQTGSTVYAIGWGLVSKIFYLRLQVN